MSRLLDWENNVTDLLDKRIQAAVDDYFETSDCFNSIEKQKIREINKRDKEAVYLNGVHVGNYEFYTVQADEMVKACGARRRTIDASCLNEDGRKACDFKLRLLALMGQIRYAGNSVFQDIVAREMFLEHDERKGALMSLIQEVV